MLMNQELGDNPNEEDSILAILRTFYPTDKRDWRMCIEEFNRLIQEPCVKPLKLNLDFEELPAEYFIIADLYLSKLDLVSLYNHLSGKSVRCISVNLAMKVKGDFLQSVAHFKEKYEWIYNPPTIGKISKHTIGKQLRDEFQKDYGAYAEITYLLSKGDAMKFDEINQMILKVYLSLGEYLLRKKSVEAVE